MPDLPRQEPFFGDALEPTTAHQPMPAGTGQPVGVPDESIGEYLRRNRQRTGKTLNDVSHALKIMSHHLVAIENNSFEELPGRAYAIGFVRSYAAYLGLDAGALVARLKGELTTPGADPIFASPDPSGARDQTGTASFENGNAEAFSAELCRRLEGELAGSAFVRTPADGIPRGSPAGAFSVGGSAQATIQLPIAKALLRLKEIAKIPRELELRFRSPAGRSNQWDAAAVENANGSEPEFGLFSVAGRRDQTRTAYAENGNAGGRNFAPFSAPRRAAPQLSSAPRGLPLRSSPEHPVRNWITAGIMGAAVIYFGSSMLYSGRVAAPPPVIPVPARMAAEAAFMPTKVVPPAVATGEHGAPEPALAPPATDETPAIAAIDKSAPILREAAVDPPTEAIPTQPDSAAPEPKRVLRVQLPLGERYGEQNRGSRVTLRVHRATFVAVLGFRNHQYIDRVLRAGDTYRVPNMRGLKLSTRDAGAVEVILDGNTVGFAGMDGAAVKGMSLQPQSIISRFHWLQE
jgi:cytoskeleton protein RodZ